MQPSKKPIIVQKGALSERGVDALSSYFSNITVVEDSQITDSLESASNPPTGLVLAGYTQQTEWIINTFRKGGIDPWIPIALISDEEIFAPFRCEYFTPNNIDALSSFLSSAYRPTILIIEDDLGLQDVLSQTLEKHYDITVFGNGLDGWDAYKNSHFDLILTDYMLPGLTGLELLERIRLNDSNTPVVVITAHDTKALKLKLLSYGANEYMAKPLSDIGLVRKTIIDVLSTEQHRKAIRGFSEQDDKIAWASWKEKLDAKLD